MEDATDVSVPLCVDLDGTLILSDTLAESFCLLIKAAPLSLPFVPIWLFRGRAHLKREITARTNLEAASLPYNPEVLDFVRREKEKGREIILVTAADSDIGQKVQDELSLFSEVLGSAGGINLKGEEKAAALVQRFGESQFDYIGNSSVDLPVWRHARKAHVVSNGQSLLEQARSVTEVGRFFPIAPIGRGDWIKALRLHQWCKNLLLFAPILGAHQWTDTGRIVSALLAFLTFGLGASSVYILNDLLDLEADRRHPSKRRRPFASGRIPIHLGFITLSFLLFASAIVATLLPWQFGAMFAVYYLTTLAYSLRLKQIAVVDVFVLASLYTIRILGGGYATSLAVSEWLLLFSMFIFLSLAFAKRFSELRPVSENSTALLNGRGYVGSDFEFVNSSGLAAGSLSVLVLALYINHPDISNLYDNPAVLWAACPLLMYWICRVWFLARRGEMNDDPILFALSDRQSWIILSLFVAIGFAAFPK